MSYCDMLTEPPGSDIFTNMQGTYSQPRKMSVGDIVYNMNHGKKEGRDRRHTTAHAHLINEKEEDCQTGDDSKSSSDTEVRSLSPSAGCSSLEPLNEHGPSDSKRRISQAELYTRRLSSAGLTNRRSSIMTERIGDSPELTYRVLVLGANRCGKTAIINQFLYEQYTPGYRETVEDMYRGEFEVGNVQLALDIEDTGGRFPYEFGPMFDVSIGAADAVLLVFSLVLPQSFKEVIQLRSIVETFRGSKFPIVVAGNKADLERKVPFAETEATVIFDWEKGYLECSAKTGHGIQSVFKEIVRQVERYKFFHGGGGSGGEQFLTEDIGIKKTNISPKRPLFFNRRGSEPVFPRPQERFQDHGFFKGIFGN